MGRSDNMNLIFFVIVLNRGECKLSYKFNVNKNSDIIIIFSVTAKGLVKLIQDLNIISKLACKLERITLTFVSKMDL